MIGTTVYILTERDEYGNLSDPAAFLDFEDAIIEMRTWMQDDLPGDRNRVARDRIEAAYQDQEDSNAERYDAMVEIFEQITKCRIYITEAELR